MAMYTNRTNFIQKASPLLFALVLAYLFPLIHSSPPIQNRKESILCKCNLENLPFYFDNCRSLLYRHKQNKDIKLKN